MEEYICDINIKISCNNMEASSEEDYIEKLKHLFATDHGIRLERHEISNIETWSEFEERTKEEHDAV